MPAGQPAQTAIWPHSSERPGVVGESFRAIDARLGHKNPAMAAGTPRKTLPTAAEAGLTVTAR
jgi:hypothetical protein